MTMVVGGIGDVGLTPAQLKQDFNAVIATLAARFKGLTWAQLYKVLQPELDRALSFVAIKPPAAGTLGVRVAALTRARNTAKINYANRPNDLVPAAELIAAREAACDILRWLAALAGQTLTDSNARAATVRSIVQGIKDAPKDTIKWALESLGLPTWLLPVALVIAGVVVLGHFTGALKALIPAPRPALSNPRRRRRRPRAEDEEGDLDSLEARLSRGTASGGYPHPTISTGRKFRITPDGVLVWLPKRKRRKR